MHCHTPVFLATPPKEGCQATIRHCQLDNASQETSSIAGQWSNNGGSRIMPKAILGGTRDTGGVDWLLVQGGPFRYENYSLTCQTPQSKLGEGEGCGRCPILRLVPLQTTLLQLQALVSCALWLKKLTPMQNHMLRMEYTLGIQTRWK